MKVVPKKDQPDVAGGYVAPEYPDSPCTPYPWPPVEPDPFQQPATPCENPLT